MAALVIAAGGCGVSATDSASSASGPDRAPDGSVNSPAPVDEGSFEGTGGAVFLSRAAEATSNVGTQKMTLDMTMTGVPMVGDINITADGEFNSEAEQGRMSMDMGDLFGAMGEDAGLPADAGQMEFVLDGETVYVRSSLFSMMGAGDTPWLSADADEFSDDSSGLTSGVEDPGAFLEFLKNNTEGEVTEVGTEEIRGVETVHVRTDLDLLALMEEAADGEREEMERQLEGLGATADSFSTVPTEAWIDRDGYVRKFTMAFDFSESGITELEGTTMTIDVELYDFGEPVTIEIPDPSEVSELDPSLLDGGF
ncbi:hypothetical protein BH20ACT3_BH20ACT3_04440 [soil metagenome]